MTTDIPQVPENEYDELICTQCLKVIGWAKCSCEKSVSVYWNLCVPNAICAG